MRKSPVGGEKKVHFGGDPKVKYSGASSKRFVMPLLPLLLLVATLALTLCNLWYSPSAVLMIQLMRHQEERSWRARLGKGRSSLSVRNESNHQSVHSLVEPPKLAVAREVFSSSSSFSTMPTITWTDKNLFHFIRHYWDRNLFCQDLTKERQRLKSEEQQNNGNATTDRLHFHLQINCQKVFFRGQLGTGNYLTALFGIRLAAQSWYSSQGEKNDEQPLVHELTMSCQDSERSKTQLILPWVMGQFSAQNHDTRSGDGDANADTPAKRKLSTNDTCLTYNKAPIGYLIQDMILEFRRMAIALVGIPQTDAKTSHEAPATTDQQRRYADMKSWAEHHLQKSQQNNQKQRSATRATYQIPFQYSHNATTTKPLIPHVELDDVIVHFRCGDLMGASAHKSYGMMPFPAYARFISPQAKTIGILTQPFSKTAATPVRNNNNNTMINGTLSLSRPTDRVDQTGQRCEIVVNALVKYLRGKFPNATRVSIRNQDSLALSYARIVMANQTISAMSSFAVFPMIATFGEAYLRRPGNPSGPYQWILRHPRAEQALSHFHLFRQDAILSTGLIRLLWATKGGPELLLHLFWHGECNQDFLSASGSSWKLMSPNLRRMLCLKS